MPITLGTQFGKYTEVIIKNFVTGEKIVIPNDFHIGFKFLKTVDEVDSASVGTVVIEGLTEETIKRIKTDGGEIEVRCGWLNDIVETLFVADIIHVVPSISNSTTVVQISCSANLITHMYGAYKHGSYDNNSLIEILNDVAVSMGVKIEIDTANVPEKLLEDYKVYLNTASYRFDVAGTPEQIFNQIHESLGFRLTSTNYNEYGKKIYILCQTVGATNEILQKITKGYAKTGRGSGSNFTVLNSGEANSNTVAGLYVSPIKSSSIALVLGKETGLLSVKTVFRIATALETQDLGSNEQETNKSVDRRIASQNKEAERKAKILEKGKEYKPKAKKVSTIKVNRKSLQIEALINPTIRPQGHVKIESMSEEYNGVYIVRQIEFEGDNKEGDWKMNILAEDTLGKYDTVATAKDVARDSSINGELGIDGIDSVDGNDGETGVEDSNNFGGDYD